MSVPRTARLFDAEPTPAEIAERTAANRAAQSALFDALDARAAWAGGCHACGSAESCSCETSGFVALTLDAQ